MKRKILNVTLFILAIAFCCISFQFSHIEKLQGTLFGLGISIMTTVIISFYESLLNKSQEEISEKKIKKMGLIDIDYNATSQFQKKIYTKSKNIRMIFSTGLGTLRKYQNEIIDLVVQNQCHIQIVLSSDIVIESGAYITPKGENKMSLNIIRDIIKKVKELNGKGCIELKFSEIGPVGSLEIKDDDFCLIVPYLQETYSDGSYHVAYKNTGNSDDIYHRWEQHFEKIWNKATPVINYNAKL